MYKKNFFLLLWVLTPFFLFGNAPFDIKRNTEVVKTTNDTCDLPAPTNFINAAVGPTWIKHTWANSAPFAQHRIKTYKVIGNVLVSNVVVAPGMTTAIVPGLQPGVQYYSVIRAICADGTDSKYFIQGPIADTLILELIVMGFNPSNSDASCAVRAWSQFCEFPINGDVSVFKIRPINSPSGRQFGVEKLNSSPRLRSRTTSNEGDYIFKMNGNLPDQFGIAGTSVEIYYLNTLIATYELYITGNVGHLIWTLPQPTGYEIVRLGNGGSGFSDPGVGLARQGDYNDQSSSTQSATASPNPFSEVLDVFPDNPSAESIHLQMYNLSGQKVLDQQFAGGQEQYSLSTAGLSSGFYLLRIEADGEVQTLKVVKSE